MMADIHDKGHTMTKTTTTKIIQIRTACCLAQSLLQDGIHTCEYCGTEDPELREYTPEPQIKYNWY